MSNLIYYGLFDVSSLVAMTERIDTVLEELLGAQRLESCIKFLESLGVVVIYQKQIQGDWVEFVLVPKRRLTSSEEILARNLKIGVSEIQTKDWVKREDHTLDKYVQFKPASHRKPNSLISYLLTTT